MFKNLCLIIHLVLLMPEALISFIFTSLNFKTSPTNVVNMHKIHAVPYFLNVQQHFLRVHLKTLM